MFISGSLPPHAATSSGLVEVLSGDFGTFIIHTIILVTLLLFALSYGLQSISLTTIIKSSD